MTSDIIRVFIHDCRAQMHIGFFDAEHGHTQPVVINVECEARLSRRYDDIGDKDLTQVINYKPLYDFITQELPRMGHIYMLESAAEKIADFCFRDARVEKVTVRLEKTSVFADAAGAGVEIVRMRR